MQQLWQQEKLKSMELLAIFSGGVVHKFPRHSRIREMFLDFQQAYVTTQEVARNGRNVLVETVCILAFKIVVDSQRLDAVKKTAAIESAKQLIRDQVAVVTQGVDGVSASMIHPGLWSLANNLLK